jgi:predicted dehydrogenase
MKRRNFLKNATALASVTILPSSVWAFSKNKKLRTAHIGVGGKGRSDLASIASHPNVEVAALCDVDSTRLAAAKKMYPNAKIFTDYRKLLDEMSGEIDAVIVSTPDHTHAPASMMAMEMGKPVYCQKPLTHHVSEARAMKKLAEEKSLVTQMGIQCHSSDMYKQAVELIRSGIIGKVSCVRAWSPKNWGYDGPAPAGSDPVPDTLDWNLWLGTAPERKYKNKIYHPAQWRKLLDYGCGTLGDMGVHIFDTPYTALELNVPQTVKNNCRKPTGFGHPEKNIVEYQFPGTKYTTESLKWVWYDGPGAPEKHEDLKLPDNDELPQQGAMFIGEKGRLLLPHWDYPQLIVDGKYNKIDFTANCENDHYHQFVDACLGKTQCSAPFSYSAKLTEAMLLGVIANRFPNKTLHWNINTGRFEEDEANELLKTKYRKF